ncbi:MAG TPA: RDD family protein [Solirubrobacteraceae bacterium]|nr:RDD family protein [Solirubrobacteraceae bacterium]
MSHDPFGRSGEEETDAFGRPVERDSLWSAGDRTDEPEPPRSAAASAPTIGGFRPPTDTPPDTTAWRTEPQDGRAPPPSPASVGQGAEWLPRAGAAFLDLLVRLTLVLAGVLLGAVLYAGGDSAGEVGTTIGAILGVVAGLAYAPWMIATRNGQTLGHRATDTRIVMANGKAVTGGRAFTREVLVKGVLFDGLLIWVTFAILPLLNYLWPLWDDRNETLHDKMCGTRVLSA